MACTLTVSQLLKNAPLLLDAAGRCKTPDCKFGYVGRHPQHPPPPPTCEACGAPFKVEEDDDGPGRGDFQLVVRVDAARGARDDDVFFTLHFADQTLRSALRRATAAAWEGDAALHYFELPDPPPPPPEDEEVDDADSDAATPPRAPSPTNMSVTSLQRALADDDGAELHTLTVVLWRHDGSLDDALAPPRALSVGPWSGNSAPPKDVGWVTLKEPSAEEAMVGERPVEVRLGWQVLPKGLNASLPLPLPPKIPLAAV